MGNTVLTPFSLPLQTSFIGSGSLVQNAYLLYTRVSESVDRIALPSREYHKNQPKTSQNIVKSPKVLPIRFQQSLTKSCRSRCEHTQAVARPPKRKGGPIDTSAGLAEAQARPSTR